jgi:hypothetical protein
MKLIDQKTGPWEDGNTNGVRVRYHTLKLVAAKGDLNIQSFSQLPHSANSDSYGGIRPGFLMVVDARSTLAEDHWDVEIVLREGIVNYLESPKIINKSGDVVQLSRPLYSGILFADHLPMCEDFPADPECVLTQNGEL